MNNRKYWKTEEIHRLHELLITKKYSFGDIGKILNRTACSCSKRAKRDGLFNDHIYRKYFVNEDFWLNYTEDTAYFGGFSSADACIAIRGKDHNHFTYMLTLKEDDQHLLYKLKLISNYTGIISHREIKNESGSITKVADLKINCDKWAFDLEKYFCIVPNKTKIIMAPKFPNDRLTLCWLVGLLDGDGCVTQSGGNPVIKITSSSLVLIEWVKKYFDGFGNKLRNKKNIIKIFKNYSLFQISGINAAQFIYFVNLLGIYCLDRKWKNPKILELVKNYKQKYPNFFNNITYPNLFT